MDENKQYLDRMSAKLRAWRAKINAISAQSHKVAAPQQIEFHRQLDLLEAKHQSIESKLQQLQKVSGVQWNELKASLDGMSNEIENALDSAEAKIS